jgi:hypothetical protein
MTTNPEPSQSPNEALPPAPPTTNVDLRMERIEEQLRDSLKLPRPLSANLGALTTDLMIFAYQIKDCMAQRVASSANGMDFGELQPHLEMYLRCVRQIDRQVRLGDNPSGQADKAR